MPFVKYARQKSKPRRNDRVLLAMGFAFTTGWVDVLCTLRFGAFGTMMTGNSIFMAKSVVSGSATDFCFYFSAIACYCLGVCIHRHTDYIRGDRTSALSAACVVAPCCLAVDVCRYLFGPSRYYVCFISVACGVVNVVSQTVAGVVTNAVTGNLQKLSNFCWEMVFLPHCDIGRACKRHAMITALVTSSFLLGIGLSAITLNTDFGGANLNWFPVAAVFTLLLWGHDLAYAHELHVQQEENRKIYMSEIAKAPPQKLAAKLLQKVTVCEHVTSSPPCLPGWPCTANRPV